MAIRRKTKQRVSIILAVLLVLVGTGAVIYVRAANRERARLARLRQDGLAAYAAGEHARSVVLLGQYLDKARAQHTDPEALFAYGRSRMIHEPTPRHLLESIKVFQTYERLRPTDAEARRLLLELYPRVGYTEEALKLADDLLGRDPRHVPALRAKARVMRRQAQRGARKYEDALQAAEELNRVAPGDLDGQFLTLYLLLDLHTDPKEIVARYEALQQAHPDDARFELLLAQAYDVAREHDKARRMLKTAAAHAAGDPALVAQIVPALDGVRMFDESLALLEAAAARLGERPADPAADPLPDGTTPQGWVRRALVRRHWQMGRVKEVDERLKGLDPAAASSDPYLLGYRALALHDLGRGDEAAAVVEALAKREHDAPAAAWAKALKAHYAKPPLPPAQLVKEYQAALEADADNALIHHLLGNALNAQGETELAIAAWRKASERAPAWGQPAAMIARAYTATGRGAEALAFAREAARRSPTVGNTAAFLNAWFGALGESDGEPTTRPDQPGEAERLLAAVRQFRASQPGDTETLHLEVALLARTGSRDEAAARARAAAQADPPPPLGALLALTAVSYAEGLGLEKDLLTAADRVYGPRPEIALRQAVLLFGADQKDDGLRLLRAGREKAVGTPVEPRWGVAVAQYLDAVDPGRSLPEWAALCDRFPNDLAVQTAALRSPARFADRDFWNRTIERLKALSGEGGFTYRLERARWLLAAAAEQAVTEKDASEAIDLLTRVIEASPALPEPRRLRAAAFERLASFKRDQERENFQNLAVEDLRAAFDRHPSDPALARELARVLKAVGKPEEVKDVMDRLAGASIRAPGRRLRTARTLAAEGRLQEAIDVLAPAGDSGAGRDPARDALLAELYRRTGRPQEATDRYLALLDADRPDPAALVSAAGFFHSKGQTERAQKFLDKLAALPLRPGEVELHRARFAERHETPEEALKHYAAATKAPGAGAEPWRALAEFHLRSRRFADASAAADAGLKAAPDDAELLSLRTRAAALDAYRNHPNLESLAEALSDDPRSAGTAEMLGILSAARASGEPAGQTADKLRALAERSPSLPLQGHVVRSYLALGRWRDAVDVATQAAAAHPNHAAPARWLVAAHTAARDWDRALAAARQWRQRSLDAPLDADLAIARVCLQSRPARAQEALEQLKPHLQPALLGDGNVAVVATYAQALIALGRVDEAADLLRPLAETSPAWRAAWLELAPVAFRDGDAAGRWVERVTPLVPAESTRECVALANAWFAVGTKFAWEPALAKAKETLQPLTERPDAGAAVWQQWSVVAEAMGDLDGAERGYRELMKLLPDAPAVQNNFAYLLLTRGRPADLAEARALAERAVAAAPDSATFHDTLARVQAAAGDRAAAAKSFREAIRRDPRSVEAMIGLADLLAREDREEVRSLLARIDDALREQARRQAPPLPPALQRQLDAVRTALRAAAAATAPVESGRAE